MSAADTDVLPLLEEDSRVGENVAYRGCDSSSEYERIMLRLR